MSAIAEAVAAFFERHDWPVDHLDADDSDNADDSGLGPERVSITSVKGEHGTWPLLVAIVGEELSYLVVQSVVPPEAPNGDEVAVLELLTRMNDGLVDGCFELNFDDGTIRLRSAVPLHSLGALDVETLTNLVGDLVTGNVTTADRFIPALEAVIDHGVAPAIAVACVEAGLDPRPPVGEADSA